MNLSQVISASKEQHVKPEQLKGRPFVVLSAKMRAIGAGKQIHLEAAFEDKTISTVAFPHNSFLGDIMKGLRAAQKEYKQKNPKGEQPPQLGPVTADQDSAGFWILKDATVQAGAAQSRK